MSRNACSCVYAWWCLHPLGAGCSVSSNRQFLFGEGNEAGHSRHNHRVRKNRHPFARCCNRHGEATKLFASYSELWLGNTASRKPDVFNHVTQAESFFFYARCAPLKLCNRLTQGQVIMLPVDLAGKWKLTGRIVSIKPIERPVEVDAGADLTGTPLEGSMCKTRTFRKNERDLLSACLIMTHLPHYACLQK